MELFTIGHSNHELKVFISLLQKHSVTAIADVRSYPYSPLLLLKAFPLFLIITAIAFVIIPFNFFLCFCC